MQNSKIQWTDHSFNPWHGCMKVSEGCRNCYAEAMDHRWGGEHWGPRSERKEMSDRYWKQPVKWNAAAQLAGIPAKVFCASMADVFEDHPQLPALRIRLFQLIDSTPWLIWQLLTKRPENIMRFIPLHWAKGLPSNIWVGTSVENHKTAINRISELLKVPASVRFLSCEPLLGPVDLSFFIGPIHIDSLCNECGHFDGKTDVNNGYGCNHPEQETKEDGHGKCFAFSCPIASELSPSEPLDKPIYEAFGYVGDEYDYLMRHYKGIHWVIAGGESGPHARPMHPDWARTLRDQCQAAGVPFFFKQWGEHYTDWYNIVTGDPVFKMFSSYLQFTHKLWAKKGDACIAFDGKICRRGDDFKNASYPVAILKKVGKKKAGRLLDGREWNEFPVIKIPNDATKKNA